MNGGISDKPPSSATNAASPAMPVSAAPQMTTYSVVSASVSPMMSTMVASSSATGMPNQQSTNMVTAPQQQHQPPPAHPNVQAVHQALSHPSVPPSSMPQVQVIQQPLHSPTYLPHMYNPPQQLLMSGNIAVSPSIQVIASKACVPNSLHPQMLAGKPVLQGQSNYIPTTSNQTLVIGQLGVLSPQSSLIPAHAKQVADSQKVRPYMVGTAGALQQKSPILPHPHTHHPQVSVAGTQMQLNSSHFKQLTSQATLTSAPQLITSQAPCMIAPQSQILNGLQAALSTGLPPGLTWAHGGLQSHVIAASNPIFIRSSQQQDMLIQSQHPAATPTHIQPQPGLQQAAQVLQSQQHLAQAPTTKSKQSLELAPNIQPKTQAIAVGPKTLPSILPSSVAPVRPSIAPIRPASSVATQTITTVHGGPHQHTRPQLKQRTKTYLNRASPAPTAAVVGSGSPVQIQLKADAANQTKIILTSAQNPLATGTQIKPATQGEMKVVATPPSVKTVPQNVVTPTASPLQSAVRSQSAPSLEVPAVPKPPMPTATALPVPPIVEPMDTSEPSTTALMPPKAAVPVTANVVPVAKPFSDTGTAAAAAIHSPPVTIRSEESVVAQSTPEAPSKTPVAEPPLPPCVLKEKQPQKAIVRPHVLTHVIEGFVIQEAPNPFPVNRSSLLNEYIPAPAPERSSGTEIPAVSRNDSPNIPEVTRPVGNNEHSEATQVDKWSGEKRHKLDLEISKCEYCGKFDVRSRFKRFKRFCSTSCAKRCTKRPAGLLTAAPSTEEMVYSEKPVASPPPPCPKLVIGQKIRKFLKSRSEGGKYPKKKKHGLKMKKSLRKMQSSRFEWVSRSQSLESGKDDETNTSNSGAESSLSPVTPSASKTLMETEVPQLQLEKNPEKWTVQNVFAFIKGLPGCADYADEFRLQEIDGQALLLLKEDHLMTALNMKLGPALKICAKINAMKEELQRQQ